MQKTEWFPIVNENGEKIGRATRKECHSGSFLLHPVVHLHVFNSHKQLFLQQRAATKDIQPNKWDTAVGGHVDDGEDIQTALYREAYEELKIENLSAAFLFEYPFRSKVEYELVHSFWTQYNLPLHPNHEEIQDARFWEIDEIKNSLGQELFTPNFEDEFTKLLANPDIIHFLNT